MFNIVQSFLVISLVRGKKRASPRNATKLHLPSFNCAITAKRLGKPSPPLLFRVVLKLGIELHFPEFRAVSALIFIHGEYESGEEMGKSSNVGGIK